MSNHTITAASPFGLFVRDRLLLGLTPGQYLRSLITPFNIVAALILCVGIPIAIRRFAFGLGATTNLNDNSPWGLWIGFDVLCGVALAAGGFILAAAVHLFGLKDYRPLVRPAILTAFLGYFFVVIGLLFDLGRPWRLPNPIFFSPGVTSVMFEVAWCVALYSTVLFVECLPMAFEWLRWRKLWKWACYLTIGATVFGVILSTLHQSALGGLFLIAQGKVHPLWYSPYIPVLFFTSAVIAGMSMVIVESMLSHRVFRSQVASQDHAAMDRLIIGLGRAASVVMMTYFALKVVALAHGQHWDLLLTPYGLWWLVEVVGFVLVPCLLFAHAARKGSAGMVRFAALIAVLGVVLNRLNVSFITYRWDQPDRYVPHWMEITITLTIVTIGLLTFRWIVNRMPVIRDHPDFEPEH
ncbi:MAG: polysulfide reductase NrfD [Planctomycetes bacterium]|nr:polysulfide reductase NrfD [Planctomycetota bacterium]